jgi:hypothetical protein
MTVVVISFICSQKLGFSLPMDISNIIGVAVAIGSLVAFLALGKRPVAGAPTDA